MGETCVSSKEDKKNKINSKPQYIYFICIIYTYKISNDRCYTRYEIDSERYLKEKPILDSSRFNEVSGALAERRMSSVSSRRGHETYLRSERTKSASHRPVKVQCSSRRKKETRSVWRRLMTSVYLLTNRETNGPFN